MIDFINAKKKHQTNVKIKQGLLYALIITKNTSKECKNNTKLVIRHCREEENIRTAKNQSKKIKFFVLSLLSSSEF